MNPVAAWLDRLPGDADITQPAIALGAALLLYMLAYTVARPIAARVRAAFPALNDTVAVHVRPMIRHAIAALLLGITAAAWPQDSLAHLVIGIFLAASIALFATHLLHSLAIPRWAIAPLALLLFVMVVSGSSGGIAPVGQMLDQVGVDLGKRRISLLDILSMAATVVALLAGIRLANRLIGHSIQKAPDLDPTQKLLGQKLASIAVVITAFFIGVDVLSIDLTAFTVFSGALGLAVGFGLQKTVGNLIAGIILLMDRSIKPGDVIVVGDSFGWVNKIGVRAVSIVTRDGKEHLIPNENLMTQEVENWSYSDRNVRVRIPVGISYASDRKLAQELMLQAALESPRVLRSPRPNVWLINLGEYRLDHEIRVWISDPESGIGNVTHDVLGRVLDKFQAHGITVPYPHRVIEMRPDSTHPQ
ncbi:mechanosensitive ion channel [Sphingobium sp. AP49]|uniref:mechanosensitive ion channel family protein n=1 Tax=Sphingobium sp. AP49 TaxID=1144307 RepID=UPI00026ED744|nr:mechanosensitive ion channel domain-containing protein [Sphingobium sp. AP49]WHO38615.1 mechanosensitive ion channel [Sphingobium sp. AP49]